MLETVKQELKDLVTSRTLYSLFIGHIFATLRYNDMSSELALIYILLIAICTLIVVLLGVRDDVAVRNKNYLITLSLDKMCANKLNNADVTPAIKEIEAIEPQLCKTHFKYNNKYSEYKSQQSN